MQWSSVNWVGLLWVWSESRGFFSALKEEVVRGLSPARSRRGRSQSPSGSGLLRRRRGSSVGPPEMFISRSGSLRPGVETLSPLREGPDPNGSDSGDPRNDRWAHWLCRAPAVSTAGPGFSRSDLRLLLGVLGAPLAPVHVSNSDPLPHLCIKDTPIETSSAQYILQQYLAASGGHKLQNSIQNAYAMGKVKMLASDIETATKVIKNKNSSKAAESGGFVLWQMNPAACTWRCTGEKKINGEDCFILKLCADPHTLKSRSEGPAEIIRHVLFGYFSQKTGLLVHLEDSHLTAG
ncbi:hypothetical protein Sango_0672200 [Sesamum angolense]|uniref:Uncharacterized protein n=1 Tax=Sesamum angolense TaxID=2727404 RepID=A0AAE1X7A6_9LAMI|nr:hypothetical protein Sango_0672200 [Sesamum angolense]